MEKKELSTKQQKLLEQKMCFAESEDLAEAFFMVDGGIDTHNRFVHYTTLPRVKQKLKSGRWWFSRANLDSLNDRQEANKYGNRSLISRMYQTCFQYGSAESAAMWGLYCPGDPKGVMISLDGKAMREWFKEVRNKKSKVCLEYKRATSKHARQMKLTKSQIEYADARDIIYAATDFADASTNGKIKKNRSKTLFWADARTGRIENLEQEINDNDVTGWIKDYEWRQENESRIVVRVKGIEGELPENLSINIPESVLRSMRFILSPWHNSESFENTKKSICALVRNLHGGKPPRNIVVPSVLTGALESWRNRYN